jgi:hypothetical protein
MIYMSDDLWSQLISCTRNSKTHETNTPWGKEYAKFIPKLKKTNSLTDTHHFYKKYDLFGT